MTPEELSDRLMNVAVRVGNVVEALPETRLGRHIASQLIRYGTAAGPNYEEGRSAESKRDFVHKLRITIKELRESKYWHRLIAKAKLIPSGRMKEVFQETDELVRILGKS